MNIVDISDTTDSANGTNKKATLLQIQEANIGADVTFNTGTITGDLTVDTDTLYVDSTNNRIGIGETSPTYGLVVGNPSTSNTGTCFVDATLNSSGKGLVISAQTRTTADNSTLLLDIINRAGSHTLCTTVAGYVGINNSSPTVQLDVNSGTANAVANFESTDATAQIFIQDNSTTNVVALERTGDNLALVPDGGYVGIGTTSPGAKLEVEQNSNAIGQLIDYNNSNTEYSLKLSDPSGNSGFRYNSTITRSTLVLHNGTSTYRLWVDNSGNLRISTSDPATESSGTVVGTQT